MGKDFGKQGENAQMRTRMGGGQGKKGKTKKRIEGKIESKAFLNQQKKCLREEKRMEEK